MTDSHTIDEPDLPDPDAVAFIQDERADALMEARDALTDFDKSQVCLVNKILTALHLPHAVRAFTETDMLQVKAEVRALKEKGK